MPGGKADDQFGFGEELRHGLLRLVGRTIRAEFRGGDDRVGPSRAARPRAGARAVYVDVEALITAQSGEQRRRHGAAAGVAGADK